MGKAMCHIEREKNSNAEKFLGLRSQFFTHSTVMKTLTTTAKCNSWHVKEYTARSERSASSITIPCRDESQAFPSRSVFSTAARPCPTPPEHARCPTSPGTWYACSSEGTPAPLADGHTCKSDKSKHCTRTERRSKRKIKTRQIRVRPKSCIGETDKGHYIRGCFSWICFIYSLFALFPITSKHYIGRTDKT